MKKVGEGGAEFTKGFCRQYLKTFKKGEGGKAACTGASLKDNFQDHFQGNILKTNIKIKKI